MFVTTFTVCKQHNEQQHWYQQFPILYASNTVSEYVTNQFSTWELVKTLCLCKTYTYVYVTTTYFISLLSIKEHVLATTSVASKGPELYLPFVTSFGEL